jgi:hypothetical protein
MLGKARGNNSSNSQEISGSCLPVYIIRRYGSENLNPG